MHEKQRRALILLLPVVAFAVFVFAQYRAVQRQRAESQAASPPPQRNIYLITVSGLNPGHLSSYLYQHIQTPAIDFLAGDGVRFTSAYTTSPESLSAHLSLLTGLYPFRSPLKETIDAMYEWKNVSTSPLSDSLPRRLKDRGYRTGAFLSDPELRIPSFFLELFDEVHTGDRETPYWQDGYRGSVVCRLARDWISANKNASHFLWLNFSDPARPFEPPSPYNLHYQNHPYDGEIAALDEQVGLFMNLLKTTGLFDKSIVIFTAPYAEDPDSPPHAGSLNDSTLHVPLMIAAPGLLPSFQMYEKQVSLIDVYPTLLALMEEGKMPVVDGTPLFAKGSTQQSGHEVILGESRLPRLLSQRARYFARTRKWKLVQQDEERMFLNFPPDTPGDSEESDRMKSDLSQHLRNNGIQLPKKPLHGPDVDAAALLTKAVALARDGRPDIGLDLLLSFQDKHTAPPALLVREGRLALLAGIPEEAAAILQKALPAASPRILPELARAYAASGRYEEALKTMDRYAGTVTHQSYYDHTTTARILYALERDTEALGQIEAALRQNQRYGDAYLQRGLLRARRKETPVALADFRQAITFDPQNVAGYRLLVALLLDGPSRQDAIPYLRKLLELDPDDYESMLQLARLQAVSGNLAEARHLSEKVLLYSNEDRLKEEAKQIIAQ